MLSGFNLRRLRRTLYVIIFGTDTTSGKRFDVVLLWVILLSIITVLLESVSDFREDYGRIFLTLEWFFTILFTLEYLLRIWVSPKPERYIFSVYGLVDLAATIPTYLSLFFAGGSYLVVIRAVRLLRVFRILKLTRYLSEAQMLISALRSSQRKIFIFMGSVTTLVTIAGTLMYMIEGPTHGFTSIPVSIYWAVVTVTTVGYGDIAPQTVLGQTFASFLMLTGYAIIAVPTGIVTSEMTRMQKQQKGSGKPCARCKTPNPSEANYCQKCGERYPD